MIVIIVIAYLYDVDYVYESIETLFVNMIQYIIQTLMDDIINDDGLSLIRLIRLSPIGIRWRSSWRVWAVGRCWAPKDYCSSSCGRINLACTSLVAAKPVPPRCSSMISDSCISFPDIGSIISFKIIFSTQLMLTTL